jgi:hypothetical protein
MNAAGAGSTRLPAYVGWLSGRHAALAGEWCAGDLDPAPEVFRIASDDRAHNQKM